MRKKTNNQLEFNFQPQPLAITQQYRERYKKISEILKAAPEIVDLAHKDLNKILKKKNKKDPGRDCEYSTDTVVRMIICQRIENTSLRKTIIRIDDSWMLREFVLIFNGPMMDFTTGECQVLKPKSASQLAGFLLYLQLAQFSRESNPTVAEFA